MTPTQPEVVTLRGGEPRRRETAQSTDMFVRRPLESESQIKKIITCIVSKQYLAPGQARCQSSHLLGWETFVHLLIFPRADSSSTIRFSGHPRDLWRQLGQETRRISGVTRAAKRPPKIDFQNDLLAGVRGRPREGSRHPGNFAMLSGRNPEEGRSSPPWCDQGLR